MPPGWQRSEEGEGGREGGREPRGRKVHSIALKPRHLATHPAPISCVPSFTPLSSRTAPTSFFRSLPPGVEYVIEVEQAPNLFVIRKQQRRADPVAATIGTAAFPAGGATVPLSGPAISSSSLQPLTLAYYYILDKVVYQVGACRADPDLDLIDPDVYLVDPGSGQGGVPGGRTS